MLKTEEDERKALIDSQNDASQLGTLQRQLSYAKGEEVATLLKQSDATARIPILAFTAKELTPSDREQLRSGFSAVVSKGASAGSRLIHAIHALDARPAAAT